MKRMAVIVFTLCMPAVIFGGTIYVPTDQPTIQAGINASSHGDTVMIANGTYVGAGNKNIVFHGKAITVRSENGSEDCVIDCQNSGRGFRFQGGETPSSIVQGITIKNGSVGMANGGAIEFYESSPSIVDCVFINNSADDFGGAINCWYSSSTITGCIFLGNTGGSGGGIECLSSAPTVINCIFSGNSAYYGGGVDCYDCSPSIINCVFSGNTAVHGGGISAIFDSFATVTNCILWGNTPEEIYTYSGAAPSVTYSDVQRTSGVYPGAGNINGDPLFVTGPHGDFYLDFFGMAISPCIDAGSGPASGVCFLSSAGVVCMNELTTRTDRIPDSGRVDMGYHYRASLQTPSPTCVPPTETPIPPTPTHTPAVTHTPCPHGGDVDGSGTITPNDAYLALEIYLGMNPPEASPPAADFCPRPDGNGAVDPGDAYGIVREYLGYPDACD